MKLENLKRKNNMNYDKMIKIRVSDRLKTIIKYYYKENYSSIIRELIIMHFESISSVLNSEVSDFYETLKPLTPEYFNYAKTKRFDTFFEKFQTPKKTQIKFRTSNLFNEALNSFWRDLKKHYPEKYGMVNSKGDLIVACILNDLYSTPEGKNILNMYAEITPKNKDLKKKIKN